MKTYTPTIGLEIHVELKTKTKMFCNSKNDPDELRPNVNICPVCMGHPGTLPVINKEAVKNVLKVGIAIGGEISDFTEFDRKNYFYPDIPKGYQISQYKYPLVKGGVLNGIKITRIHLEEDTATSLHEEGDLPAGEAGYSLIDFNRAGVPLMELVTEPVIHTVKEASDFAKELQLLLRYLGVSEANMEKGEMRVEANISISLWTPDVYKLGTKTEVKNLNSFKAVEKAIDYEIKRQTELLENNEKVVQETRGWNDSKGITYSQRAKEDSHDYRYFPDPDLPKLKISEISEFSKETLTKEIGELPFAKRERFKNDFGATDKEIAVFIELPEVAKYFEEVVKGNSNIIKLSINYILSDYLGLLKKENKPTTAINTDNFSKLMIMINDKKISSRGAKDILAFMIKEDSDPEEIAEKNGLLQKNNEGEIKKIVEEIIKTNQKVVSDYKNGKEASLQFLIGQGMKITKGSANPEMLKKLFKESLT
ncbi:MAG: Asp-tRNA(Asn)/Glu-tRNA(Gln) amidotransferase subunit GatB [Patescibacteria group bacterium]